MSKASSKDIRQWKLRILEQQDSKKEEDFKNDLMSRKGPENVHRLHDEMAEWMVRMSQ